MYDQPQIIEAIETSVTSFKDTQEVLAKLAPTQPLYLYSARRLEQTVDAFLDGFPGTTSYALKANPHPWIVQTLWQRGVRVFDVASIGEIRLLRKLLPARAVLNFNNPLKSQADIATAYSTYGVRSFVTDDQLGLDKILALKARDIEITVRFKLAHQSAAYNFGSKFGAEPELANRLLRQASQAVDRVSLTFHPGSQCLDPEQYVRYIQSAAAMIKHSDCQLHHLNVGGGFPVAYRNIDAPALSVFFDSIKHATQQAFKDQKTPQLLCEPGRAMVANAVSLVCQVIHHREDATIIINDGIYGGLQEQLLTNELPLQTQVWRNNQLLTGELVATTVFGPTCDPVDRLPSKLQLPNPLKCGDYVQFMQVGAYGSTMTTQFNGFDSSQYVRVDEIS